MAGRLEEEGIVGGLESAAVVDVADGAVGWGSGTIRPYEDTLNANSWATGQGTSYYLNY